MWELLTKKLRDFLHCMCPLRLIGAWLVPWVACTSLASLTNILGGTVVHERVTDVRILLHGAGATALGKLHMVNLAASEMAEREGDGSLRTLGSCLQVQAPTHSQPAPTSVLHTATWSCLRKSGASYSPLMWLAERAQCSRLTCGRERQSAQDTEWLEEGSDMLMGCARLFRRCGRMPPLCRTGRAV
jgi:hypothetical protein